MATEATTPRDSLSRFEREQIIRLTQTLKEAIYDSGFLNWWTTAADTETLTLEIAGEIREWLDQGGKLGYDR